MKIYPTYDILIAGVHSPRGVAVEVADATAKVLVADGLAVRELPASSAETQSVAGDAVASESAPLPVAAPRRKSGAKGASA